MEFNVLVGVGSAGIALVILFFYLFKNHKSTITNKIKGITGGDSQSIISRVLIIIIIMVATITIIINIVTPNEIVDGSIEDIITPETVSTNETNINNVTTIQDFLEGDDIIANIAYGLSNNTFLIIMLLTPVFWLSRRFIRDLM